MELAKKHGANINTGGTVISFEDNGDSVIVKTDKSVYSTKKLILSTGPWINELLNGYQESFKVYRQVLYWFDLKDKTEYDIYNKIPVFIWEFGGSDDDFVYGFPAVDGPEGGLKVATEEYANSTSPDEINRKVSQDEIDIMYKKYIKDRIPGLSSKCIKASACLYTVTPEHRFLIDWHPKHRNVIVASPCSGHGFKHSSAIGEVLSQMARTGKSDLDISEFGFDKL